MKRLLLISLLCLVLVGWGALVSAQEGGGLPTLDDLEEGWTMLEPGGDTLCSQGTPYAFWVRPADTGKLLVYFEGGGACWFGQICDLQGSPTYDPFVDETDDPGAAPAGIFDLENPDNPFADYSMVFVPYCTADVHIGNAETTYEVPATDDVQAHEVTVHHNGYANAMSALAWTFANFDAPETIFVSGSSAGSIPSPFYGGLIAEQYPDAQIAVLGDAAGAYHLDFLEGTAQTLNEAWGTLSILPDWEEYAAVTEDGVLTFEELYIAAATRFPDVRFAQYNAAHDQTQYFFLSLVGITETPLPDLLDLAFTQIGEAVDNFRYYTAGGDVHVILPRPEFYTYTVGDMSVRDWVAALAAGEDVENVVCTECEEPELIEGE